MNKKVPSQLPEFHTDEKIAVFMEQYDGFELVEAGLATLATLVPTPHYVRKPYSEKTLLKDKKVQIAFRNEKSLQKAFSTPLSSKLVFFVIDSDISGILLHISGSRETTHFYVPYANITAIKIVDR
ncbi:MAG: hypothetical protein ACE5IR_26585 [bacterium]